MGLTPETKARVEALMLPFGEVSVRAMFGGAGIYKGGVMFGLVAGERVYLRTDDKNRPQFEAAGSRPFVYEGKGKPVTMPYCELPADALDDPERLIAWSESAYQAALRVRDARPRRGGRRRPDARRRG